MDWALLVGIASVLFIFMYGLFRVLSGARGSVSESIETPRVPSSGPRGPVVSEGERRTRNCLEMFFEKPFHKARPEFLKNKVTQANLELDCFNEELQLAAEYNGRQHYEFTPYFHASKEMFYNQQYRDEQKRIACKESGVTLIEVPYTEDEWLEEWLTNQLISLGYTRASPNA